MGAEMSNKVPDLGGFPLYAAQSLFGLSGGTAYVGVLDIAKAKAGEVFVISGAAGSVGTLAGQIAKIQGCTVIGIAGSAEKVQMAGRRARLRPRHRLSQRENVAERAWASSARRVSTSISTMSAVR